MTSLPLQSHHAFGCRCCCLWHPCPFLVALQHWGYGLAWGPEFRVSVDTVPALVVACASYFLWGMIPTFFRYSSNAFSLSSGVHFIHGCSTSCEVGSFRTAICPGMMPHLLRHSASACSRSSLDCFPGCFRSVLVTEVKGAL